MTISILSLTIQSSCKHLLSLIITLSSFNLWSERFFCLQETFEYRVNKLCWDSVRKEKRILWSSVTRYWRSIFNQIECLLQPYWCHFQRTFPKSYWKRIIPIFFLIKQYKSWPVALFPIETITINNSGRFFFFLTNKQRC